MVLRAAPQFDEAQTLQIQSAEFSAWFETWQMYNGIDKKRHPCSPSLDRLIWGC